MRQDMRGFRPGFYSPGGQQGSVHDTGVTAPLREGRQGSPTVCGGGGATATPGGRKRTSVGVSVCRSAGRREGGGGGRGGT